MQEQDPVEFEFDHGHGWDAPEPVQRTRSRSSSPVSRSVSPHRSSALNSSADSPNPSTASLSPSNPKSDLIVKFNLVVQNMSPNSTHVFKSLGPSERHRVHSLAEGFGLYHWSEWCGVRHTKTRVLIISNRDSDKGRTSSGSGKSRIVQSLAAATTADLGNDPLVQEVVSKNQPASSQQTKSSGKGPILCITCSKSCKGATGLRAHMRVHK